MPTSEQHNLIDTELEKIKLQIQEPIFNFIKRGYAEHLTLKLDSRYDQIIDDFLGQEPVTAEEIDFTEEQEGTTSSTKVRKKINSSSNMRITFGGNQ